MANAPAPPPDADAARPAPATDERAAALLLDSVRVSLGAQTVALLRHEPAADAYAVVAHAGLSPTRPGPFAATENALHRVPDDGSVSVLDPDAFGALRYHAEPTADVGRAAAVRVPAPTRHLLVADRRADAEPFDARHLALLGDYADVLGRLLTPTDETTAGAMPAADVPPPRSAILAQEMDAARAAGRPLAFALIAPADSEAVAVAGEEAVAASERALRDRLAGVEGTARVERFGELLMGAFCYGDAAEAEAWAERVGAAGEPVHIGVAVLGERHAEPEALRSDALEALNEAYERGEPCVILE